MIEYYSMIGTSTLTSKGQVAIPKAIRDHFGLKPFDQVQFQIIKGEIVVQPVMKVEDMIGIIKNHTPLSKAEQKRIIRESVEKKYAASRT